MTRIESSPSPARTEGVAVDMQLNRLLSGADLSGLTAQTLDLLHEAALAAAGMLAALVGTARVARNQQAVAILDGSASAAYGFANRIYDEAMRRTARGDQEYRLRVALRDAVECGCDEQSLRRAADALGVALTGRAN